MAGHAYFDEGTSGVQPVNWIGFHVYECTNQSQYFELSSNRWRFKRYWTEAIGCCDHRLLWIHMVLFDQTTDNSIIISARSSYMRIDQRGALVEGDCEMLSTPRPTSNFPRRVSLSSPTSPFSGPPRNQERWTASDLVWSPQQRL